MNNPCPYNFGRYGILLHVYLTTPDLDVRHHSGGSVPGSVHRCRAIVLAFAEILPPKRRKPGSKSPVFIALAPTAVTPRNTPPIAGRHVTTLCANGVGSTSVLRHRKLLFTVCCRRLLHPQETRSAYAAKYAAVRLVRAEHFLPTTGAANHLWFRHEMTRLLP